MPNPLETRITWTRPGNFYGERQSWYPPFHSRSSYICKKEASHAQSLQKLAKTFAKRFEKQDQTDKLVESCAAIGTLVDHQATSTLDRIKSSSALLNSLKTHVANKRVNTRKQYENTTKYHEVMHSTLDELNETVKLYGASAKKKKDDEQKYDSALRNKNPIFRIGDHEERVSKLREKAKTSGIFDTF